MENKDFRVDGVCCLGVWECVEVMVLSEDYIRYRLNNKVSRPCKIYHTLAEESRAYFRYGNGRIYLDECFRP